ncbi:schlafen 1 [Paramuricea clavata]|uniref:Schlafen 1 n=1 Tax=Paramuricea clavata TaxID=317549 RepID=A0A6S7FLL1_PARCT|nr:schlafen 1 [Paramuricea clavata]
MLSRAMNYLKRKRSDKGVTTTGEPSQAIVPYIPQSEKEDSTVKKEGLFARAFRKIKRRILRVYQPKVPAICLCKTPANGTRTQARYEITPQHVEKESINHLLPRYYILNQFVDMRESRNFEFKTGGGAYPIHILPEHIRKYGSAFLNCDGGVLIAGILDNGLVKGIFCDRRMQDRIRSTVEREMSEFYPPVHKNLYSVYFIPIFDRRLGQYLVNIQVVEIVFKGGEPLALYECGRHMVYLKREGSVDGPLSPLRIKDIVLRKYRSVR